MRLRISAGRVLIACSAAVLLCFTSAAQCQQPGPAGGAEASQEPSGAGSGPQLKLRPIPAKTNKPEGKIRLDVAVTDASGKAVTGLEESDFMLLDDDQPSKVVSFVSFDEKQTKADPPVEVILLIDQLNETFQQVAFARAEISKFLLKNNGHLAHPVSIMVLSDAGLRMQSRPSTDGNALLNVLEQLKGSAENIGANGKSISDKFLLSLREFGKIAEIEAKKPGRKLLIWMGPGWTVDSDYTSSKKRDLDLIFDTIVEITNRLREGGVVVNSVSGNQPGAGIDGFDPVSDLNAMTASVRYQSFLKGVVSAKQAQRGDLDLKVFATHTGGRILGPGNDLVVQIEECAADADMFYRISFDPPPPARADEYRSVKIQLRQPGLTVRTSSGYYNEPAWK
jgi:VWFA-related protein